MSNSEDNINRATLKQIVNQNTINNLPKLQEGTICPHRELNTVMCDRCVSVNREGWMLVPFTNQRVMAVCDRCYIAADINHYDGQAIITPGE
jgi:hypothetical protein